MPDLLPSTARGPGGAARPWSALRTPAHGASRAVSDMDEALEDTLDPEIHAACDPGTDLALLADIAYRRAELRPLVAANPAIYPGLRQWLAALGDRAVTTALAGNP